MAARVLRMHHAFDAELEWQVVVGAGHAAADEVGANGVGDGGAVDERRAAHHEELVVNVNGRKGVQGVAAVAAEVGTLGRRADEGIEVAVDDGGTNWMQAGRAVPSQCGEKRKSNA